MLNGISLQGVEEGFNRHVARSAPSQWLKRIAEKEEKHLKKVQLLRESAPHNPMRCLYHCGIGIECWRVWRSEANECGVWGSHPAKSLCRSRNLRPHTGQIPLSRKGRSCVHSLFRIFQILRAINSSSILRKKKYVVQSFETFRKLGSESLNISKD